MHRTIETLLSWEHIVARKVADERALAEVLRETLGLIHMRSVGDTLGIMHGAGLSLAQMVALFALHRLGAHTVTGIAARLRLSPAVSLRMQWG